MAVSRRTVTELFAASLLLTTPLARADTNPKKLNVVAAAMQNAQRVYVEMNDYDNSGPSDDFLLFYNGLQALNRYQFVADARQADLVLRYDAGGGSLRTVVVLDAKTLRELGEFSSAKGFPQFATDAHLSGAAKAEVKKAVVLIGSSKATNPPTPLPPPPPRPHAPKVLTSAVLQAFPRVRIVDLGPDKDFYSGKQSFQPGQMGTLLASELAGWAGHTFVNSPADTDLILKIEGVDNIYETRGDGIQLIDNDNYEVELTILDAKTLYPLATMNTPAILKVKKNQPDPRTTDIHNLATAFLTELSH